MLYHRVISPLLWTKSSQMIISFIKGVLLIWLEWYPSLNRICCDFLREMKPLSAYDCLSPSEISFNCFICLLFTALDWSYLQNWSQCKHHIRLFLFLVRHQIVWDHIAFYFLLHNIFRIHRDLLWLEYLIDQLYPNIDRAHSDHISIVNGFLCKVLSFWDQNKEPSSRLDYLLLYMVAPGPYPCIFCPQWLN